MDARIIGDVAEPIEDLTYDTPGTDSLKKICKKQNYKRKILFKHPPYVTSLKSIQISQY